MLFLILKSHIIFSVDNVRIDFRLIIDNLGQGEVKTQRDIEAVITQVWRDLDLSRWCGSESQDNINFLRDKIFIIIHQHKHQSIDDKLDIVSNVIRNFQQNMQEAFQRVKKDKKEKSFQSLFGTYSHSTILSITCLGQETHNKGSIPLLVEFNDHVKVVYKPRSVISEEVICDSKQGLLRHFGFGTYGVWKGEGYGYCSFLENKNNLIKYSELDQYVQKLFTLEKVAQSLRLEDLHAGNLIVQDKTPFVIDTEVILMPEKKFKEEGTELLNDMYFAGYRFNTYESSERCKNTIKIKGQFEKVKLGFLDRLFGLSSEKVVIDSEKVLDENLSLRILKQEIESTKKALENQEHPIIKSVTRQWRNKESVIAEAITQLQPYRHRIVLISTDHLSHIITCSHDVASQAFLASLRDKSLQDEGFRLYKKEEAILQKLKIDIQNNDVPIFYFDPQSRKVFYHGIAIGRFSF